MNRVWRLPLALLLNLLCLAWAATPAAAQEEFRWQFEVGQEYRLHQSIVTLSETSFGNNKRTARRVMSQYLTWVVTEIDEENNATIVEVLNRIVTEYQGNEGEILRYDSDQPEKDSVNIPWSQPLVGEELEYVISARGELLSFTVPESVMEEIESDARSSEELISYWKGSVDRLLITFPTGAIAAGDSWSRTSEDERHLYDTAYAYTSPQPEDDTSLAQFELTIVVELKEPEEEANPENSSLEYQWDITGEILFDQQAGYMTESSQHSVGTCEMESGGLEISTINNSTLKLKFYRVEE